MVLTGYVLYDGVNGIYDAFGFCSPEDTYNDVLLSLKKNIKYGAFKLDVENGLLHYKRLDPKDPNYKSTSQKDLVCSFVIFAIEENVEDDFSIDVMTINMNKDINTIYGSTGKEVQSKKISYQEFKKLV